MSYKRGCGCDDCKAIRRQCRLFENREDGYADQFLAEFKRQGGVYQIIVWDCPADSFGKGVSHHHRYGDGRLCQRAGYESRTLEHAEAFLHWWMKRWSIYVRTGEFPMTSESVDVPDR